MIRLEYIKHSERANLKRDCRPLIVIRAGPNLMGRNLSVTPPLFNKTDAIFPLFGHGIRSSSSFFLNKNVQKNHFGKSHNNKLDDVTANHTWLALYQQSKQHKNDDIEIYRMDKGFNRGGNVVC